MHPGSTPGADTTSHNKQKELNPCAKKLFDSKIPNSPIKSPIPAPKTSFILTIGKGPHSMAFYLNKHACWPFQCCGCAYLGIFTEPQKGYELLVKKTMHEALLDGMLWCKSMWNSPSFVVSLPYPHKDTEEFLSKIPYVLLEKGEDYIGVLFIAKNHTGKTWEFTTPGFVKKSHLPKEYHDHSHIIPVKGAEKEPYVRFTFS